MQSITGRDPLSGLSMEIAFHAGRIVSITDGPREETAWLSAGLIDLQVNGYRGFDLNAEDLTPDTVIALAKSLTAVGVTTFLPTLITQSEERLLAGMRAIAVAREQDGLAAHMIAGIHVEGPAISAEDGPRGAHLRQHIRPPSLQEFDRWQSASKHLIRLVTLSPHYKEAPAYTAALRSQGVHVSIGHSSASVVELRSAIDAGVELSTHLGNGIAEVVPRHPNLLWTQLADDRLTAMLIADGHHLPVDTIKVILRAKGPERIVLVSDLVALGGLPPGLYESPVGGHVELGADGRLSLAGTRYLAGAAAPLKDGIAHLVKACGVSLAEALKFATINPGRSVGGRGELKVGACCDLVRFTLSPDNEIRVETVIAAGEIVP
jgi:N-acetylglucosamine-6-phosphate deacetylase